MKPIHGIWIALLLAIPLTIDNARAASLSREIAPDVPAAVLEKLLPEAKIYLTGEGFKDVLLLADPFCENSRRSYGELQERRKQLRTLKILWISVYPQKGSEVAAAAAMKMEALGKGESALQTVFDLPVPSAAAMDKAQSHALSLVHEAFAGDLRTIDLAGLKPEMEQIRNNTRLADEIGYKGTPHFIVDGRVLHGHSSPAIRILLRQP